MPVVQLLAVTPTADFGTARTWYTQLTGRPADRSPMDGCDEWQLTESGSIQLYRDPEHAGTGQLTLGVTDLDEHAAVLAERGLQLTDVHTVPSGQFRIGFLRDPDGNSLVFAQDLRAQTGATGSP